MLWEGLSGAKMSFQVSVLQHSTGSGHEGQRLLSRVTQTAFRWKETTASAHRFRQRFLSPNQITVILLSGLKIISMWCVSYQTRTSGNLIYKKHKSSSRMCASQIKWQNITQRKKKPVEKKSTSKKLLLMKELKLGLLCFYLEKPVT